MTIKKPSITEHNIETNQITTRQMNENEFAQYQIEQTEKTKKQSEAEANATAKSALLERLGITADEAKLLIG